MSLRILLTDTLGSLEEKNSNISSQRMPFNATNKFYFLHISGNYDYSGGWGGYDQSGYYILHVLKREQIA